MAEMQSTAVKKTAQRKPKKSPIEVLAAAKEGIFPESPKEEIEIIPKRKILFVASEATPFIATGGLAEVIGSLSKALAKDSFYARSRY